VAAGILGMLGPLLLFICAVLWGGGFVAQKCGADHLGPFAVLCWRSVYAALFLWGCVRVAKGRGFTRSAWIGGGLAGVALFLASLAQQIGIMSTTPGISAFLTANYVLLVPVFGLVLGRRTGLVAWFGVVVALTGSYFICIDPATTGFAIGRGELWILLCAVLFTVQILLVDRFAPGTDVIAFSCVQQVMCIVFSIPFLFLASERVHFNGADLAAAFGPVAFLGIVSSGIAYSLQNLGQVRTPPTLAAILMSLESVFGAFAGYLWFGDLLTARQLFGCALVLVAAVGSPLLSRSTVDGARVA